MCRRHKKKGSQASESFSALFEGIECVDGVKDNAPKSAGFLFSYLRKINAEHVVDAGLLFCEYFQEIQYRLHVFGIAGRSLGVELLHDVYECLR